MRLLIEELCIATEQWATELGEDRDNEAMMRALRYVGIANEQMPSIAQLRERLAYLVNEQHLDEEFLVVSLIHQLDRHFASGSEDSTVGLNCIRQNAGQIDALVNNQEDLEGYLSIVNDERSITHPEQPPATEEEMRQLAQHLRERATPSVDDLCKRRRSLDAWRKLTELLLSAENLDLHRKLETMRAFAAYRDWLHECGADRPRS